MEGGSFIFWCCGGQLRETGSTSALPAASRAGFCQLGNWFCVWGRFWPFSLSCLIPGTLHTTERLGQNYVYTVNDCILDDVPAKITVYAPYIRGSAHFKHSVNLSIKFVRREKTMQAVKNHSAH